MRVSRAQAQENRSSVIAAASRLFREHGFDGIGLADLMKAAGLTHGGFYKQFGSKEDLAVLASERALQANTEAWSRVTESAPGHPLAALVDFYLSGAHRDSAGEGCSLAALGPDAARHGPALRQTFQDGIEAYLGVIDATLSTAPDEATRDASIAILSSMVGALLLARVVDDEALSQRILEATAREILGRADHQKVSHDVHHA